MNENLQYLLLNYLKKLEIRIPAQELKLQLLSHPSYPSLHSITGVLNHFKIENLALEVPVNMETLKQLPKTFLSLTSLDGAKEYTVVSQQDDIIELVYSSQRKEKLSIAKFLENWSGIIVAAEKNDDQGLNRPVEKRNFVKYVLLGLSVLSVIVLFIFSGPETFQLTHFVLAIAGLAISILIVNHELGFQSKITNAICTSNPKTSCEEVLNSKGAKIVGNVKLSDLSLVYFGGLIIAWVFHLIYNLPDTIVGLLSGLGMLVVIFSVYYQKVVVKKWCPLCLGIAGILVLQFGALLLFRNGTFNTLNTLSIQSALVVTLSFIIVFAGWLFIRPLIESDNELKSLQVDHYKFKRNFDLFSAVHRNNKILRTNIGTPNEIILGQPNAPLKIVLVTNPSCYYCKSAHTDIEALIKQYPKELGVHIRFSVSKERSELAYEVAHKLLELYNTTSQETTKVALHEAYKSGVDFEEWLLKWGKVQSRSFDKVLKMQSEWCKDNEIFFTPALIVNDRLFPKEYDRADISYFIEDLMDEKELEESENIMEEAV